MEKVFGGNGVYSLVEMVAERKCFAAKRFARTLVRMAVTKDQARPGPGLARPAPPAGSGGAKKQKTEARAQNRGPHWTPVELLVGGALELRHRRLRLGK